MKLGQVACYYPTLKDISTNESVRKGLLVYLSSDYKSQYLDRKIMSVDRIGEEYNQGRKRWRDIPGNLLKKGSERFISFLENRITQWSASIEATGPVQKLRNFQSGAWDLFIEIVIADHNPARYRSPDSNSK